jgi:hypothetical protein
LHFVRFKYSFRRGEEMKMLYKFIVLCLVFTFCIPITVIAKDNKSSMSFDGITYLDLPLKEFGGPTITSVVQLDSIDVKQSKLMLSGSVQYQEHVYPFNLTGKLEKSTLNTDKKIGLIVETYKSELELIHASMDLSPSKSMLFKPELESQPTCSLYFQLPNTREFTFFNIPINALTQKFKGIDSKVRNEVLSADSRAKFRGKWDKKASIQKENIKTEKEEEQWELDQLATNDFYYHKLFQPTEITIHETARSDVGTTSDEVESPNDAKCINSIAYVREACNTPSQYVVVYTPTSPSGYVNEILKWSFKYTNKAGIYTDSYFGLTTALFIEDEKTYWPDGLSADHNFISLHKIQLGVGLNNFTYDGKRYGDYFFQVVTNGSASTNGWWGVPELDKFFGSKMDVAVGMISFGITQALKMKDGKDIDNTFNAISHYDNLFVAKLDNDSRMGTPYKNENGTQSGNYLTLAVIFRALDSNELHGNAIRSHAEFNVILTHDGMPWTTKVAKRALDLEWDYTTTDQDSYRFVQPQLSGR